MASKRKADKAPAVAPQSKAAEKQSGRPIATAMAASGSANAAAVITEYGKAFGEQDTTDLILLLSDLNDLVRQGDLSNVEAMLYGQAIALQSIFANLARRATRQQYLKHEQTYLGLGLKAQSQSRATLETLVMMKNPAPVAFVRQANIGQAVQVNNGPAARAGAAEAARARENENLQSKLSGGGNQLPEDTGASTLAGGTDPQMEAVGAINGAEDNSR